MNEEKKKSSILPGYRENDNNILSPYHARYQGYEMKNQRDYRYNVFEDIESFTALQNEWSDAFTEEELSTLSGAYLKEEIIEQTSDNPLEMNSFVEEEFTENSISNFFISPPPPPLPPQQQENNNMYDMKASETNDIPPTIMIPVISLSNHDEIREQNIQRVVEEMIGQEEKKRSAKMFRIRTIATSIILAVTVLSICLLFLLEKGGKKMKVPGGEKEKELVSGTLWMAYGQRLLATEGASEYGESVDFNGKGTVLAVGAYEAQGGCGNVKVMTYTATVGWHPLGNTLSGLRKNQKFGSTVQLSRGGNILVVGAFGSSTFGQGEYGHVFGYEYDSTNFEWRQIGQPVQGDHKGDRFGISLSMAANGMSWVVGADNDRHDDREVKRDGYAKVYELFDGEWKQKGQTIHGWDGSWSAYAVAMSGDGHTVCLGDRTFQIHDDFAPGRTRCLRWWEPSRDWRPLGGDILGEYHGGQEGYSLALNEAGTVLVTSQARVGSGYVRVYQFVAGNWIQMGETLSGENSVDQMGFKVSLNKMGDVLAYTGRGFDSPMLNNTGVVRVRQWNKDKWEPLGPDVYGSNAEDYFGESIALNDHGKLFVASANWNTVEYVNTFVLV